MNLLIIKDIIFALLINIISLFFCNLLQKILINSCNINMCSILNEYKDKNNKFYKCAGGVFIQSRYNIDINSQKR